MKRSSLHPKSKCLTVVTGESALRYAFNSLAKLETKIMVYYSPIGLSTVILAKQFPCSHFSGFGSITYKLLTFLTQEYALIVKKFIAALVKFSEILFLDTSPQSRDSISNRFSQKMTL